MKITLNTKICLEFFGIFFLVVFEAQSQNLWNALSTSEILQPNFSQLGIGNVEIQIFFIFISSRNFKHDFLREHFSKFALCSTNFDELCMISTCILQTSHSQIDVDSAEIWIFFVFLSSKNSERDFLRNTFFRIRTLYARFSGSIEQYALYSSGTCWHM